MKPDRTQDISTSTTMFVVFRPISKQKWPPSPIPKKRWHIVLRCTICARYVAIWASCCMIIVTGAWLNKILPFLSHLMKTSLNAVRLGYSNTAVVRYVHVCVPLGPCKHARDYAVLCFFVKLCRHVRFFQTVSWTIWLQNIFQAVLCPTQLFQWKLICSFNQNCLSCKISNRLQFNFFLFPHKLFKMLLHWHTFFNMCHTLKTRLNTYIQMFRCMCLLLVCIKGKLVLLLDKAGYVSQEKRPKFIGVPVKCETKQKRNGTKRNRSKRNETNRNETKQIETKRNKSKRNETKRNETNRNETKRVVWNAKLTYNV